MAAPELTNRPARIEIEGTDGIALRGLVLDDAQRYFDLIDADRGHFKYGQEVTPEKYTSVEKVIDSIEHPQAGRTRFGIWDHDTMVGSINLSDKRPGVMEVGYWVGGEHKGHGYAQKALGLVMGYAFNDLNLSELIAWVHPENAASIKTLERNGFQLDMTSQELRYVLRRDQVAAALDE